MDSAGNVISLGLLPVTALNCQIICPSIFTKSKWARRKLSINELGEAFDQPLEVIDLCMERKYHSKTLPFTSGIPNKVIQWSLRRLGLSNIDSIENNKTTQIAELPTIEIPPGVEEVYDGCKVK